MLQALIVVTGIALADSVNPATIGPAVVFALSAEHPARRVLAFAAGAFAANMAGGALLVLGPGHWLLSLLPSPSSHARHVGEIIGGVALLAAGCVVWLARHRLAERELPGTAGGRGRAFTTGATLMAVELPTAFPYFAAIAVIAGLDRSVLVELLLVALFNVVFLAPLLLIAALVHFSSGIRTEAIRSAAGWLNGHWPAIFAWVLWVAGFVLVVLGAVRLDRQ